jgi:hypothetical protein
MGCGEGPQQAAFDCGRQHWLRSVRSQQGSDRVGVVVDGVVVMIGLRRVECVTLA